MQRGFNIFSIELKRPKIRDSSGLSNWDRPESTKTKQKQTLGTRLELETGDESKVGADSARFVFVLVTFSRPALSSQIPPYRFLAMPKGDWLKASMRENYKLNLEVSDF